VRSAFECNVVTSFEAQEAVLDHAFDRLNLRGGRVAHPLLLTEPPLAPPSSRTRIAELVFETYGAPSLALGVDAAFAWAAAGATRRIAPNAAAVVACAGHTASHILPMLPGGELLLSAAVRVAPGGLAVTEHLAQLLALRYPAFAAVGVRAEELKHALCHVALDYAAEAASYSRLQRAAAVARWNVAPDGDAEAVGGGGGGGGSGRFAPGRLARVQLPWAPQRGAPGAPAPPTAEELARKAEQRRAAVRPRAHAHLPACALRASVRFSHSSPSLSPHIQGDRLRAMAASRRALKADALAAEVSFLESSAAAVQNAAAEGDEESLADALAEAGFASEEALIRALGAAAQRLRKLRGGGVEDDAADDAPPPPPPVDDSVKYPLLNVPDSELSPDDLKAKRRQRLLKGGEEARARARAAKAAAAAADAAEADAAAQRFAADPDAFLAELRASRADVERRVEARKARKLGTAAPVRRGGYVTALLCSFLRVHCVFDCSGFLSSCAGRLSASACASWRRPPRRRRPRAARAARSAARTAALAPAAAAARAATPSARATKTGSSTAKWSARAHPTARRSVRMTPRSQSSPHASLNLEETHHRALSVMLLLAMRAARVVAAWMRLGGSPTARRRTRCGWAWIASVRPRFSSSRA
jgi:hypothetical protein